MSDLRERTQEINAEYWASRETLTERVVVAQFAVAFARAELDAVEAATAARAALLDELETAVTRLIGVRWVNRAAVLAEINRRRP